MSKKARRKINLALQGGGSHGAVTWGVIDRLLEDERIDVGAISGASAGAVTAAALAYSLHLGGASAAREKLEELWRTISDVGAFYSPIVKTPFEFFAKDFGVGESIKYQAFDAFTRLFSPYHFNPFDINPLRDVLKRCIDFDELRNCKATTLFLSATNVRTGKVHVFKTKDASVDSVLASACLPCFVKVGTTRPQK